MGSVSSVCREAASVCSVVETLEEGGTTDNTDPGFARHGSAWIRLGPQQNLNNFQTGLSFEGGACVSWYVIGIPKGETRADRKVDRRGGAAGESPPGRYSDTLSRS